MSNLLVGDPVCYISELQNFEYSINWIPAKLLSYFNHHNKNNKQTNKPRVIRETNILS